MSYTVEQVITVGQVATPKEIRVKLEEARELLADKISEQQLVPVNVGEYHMESFALSSCIYARVSAEIRNDEQMRTVSHAA